MILTLACAGAGLLLLFFSLEMLLMLESMKSISFLFSGILCIATSLFRAYYFDGEDL